MRPTGNAIVLDTQIFKGLITLPFIESLVKIKQAGVKKVVIAFGFESKSERNSVRFVEGYKNQIIEKDLLLLERKLLEFLDERAKDDFLTNKFCFSYVKIDLLEGYIFYKCRTVDSCNKECFLPIQIDRLVALVGYKQNG